MAKRYDEVIEVVADPVEANAPAAFRWRGRRYEVDQRLASWQEANWANGRGRSPDRSYFRVLARPAGSLATGDLDPDGFLVSAGAVYDVYREGTTWRLARIWD